MPETRCYKLICVCPFLLISWQPCYTLTRCYLKCLPQPGSPRVINRKARQNSCGQTIGRQTICMGYGGRRCFASDSARHVREPTWMNTKRNPREGGLRILFRYNKCFWLSTNVLSTWKTCQKPGKNCGFQTLYDVPFWRASPFKPCVL